MHLSLHLSFNEVSLDIIIIMKISMISTVALLSLLAVVSSAPSYYQQDIQLQQEDDEPGR